MGGPDGIGDQLDELDSVVERLESDLDGVDVGLGPGPLAEPVDPTELAGSSGQAQENRAIHRSQAWQARERALSAHESLQELSRRVRAGLEQVREFRGAIGAVSGPRWAAQLRGAMDAVTGDDPDTVASSVAAAALGFDGVEHATVCLRRPDGTPRHTAGSDETGTALTQAQERVGQGPYLDAVEDGRAVPVRDLCSAGSPWPMLGAAVTGLGVTGAVAVPLRPATTDTDAGTGSLTLWTRRADAVSAPLVAVAELFARYAGLALTIAERRSRLRTAGTAEPRPSAVEQPDGPTHTIGRSRERDQYEHLAPVLREFAGLPEDDPRRAELREQLVCEYRPVVEHIARRFRDRGEPLDDLEQAGAIGLVNAVDRFDPEHGGNFLAFAVPTITGEIRRHFRDRSWSLHVPRRQRDLHIHLARAQEQLAIRLHRAPRVSELAEHLELPRDEVIEALAAQQAYSTHPIDPPTDASEADAAPADWSARIAELDRGLDAVEARETLRPVLATLPERERAVLMLRFYGNQTQTQIAEQIGVSQMHVSRILSRTLARLREQIG